MIGLYIKPTDERLLFPPCSPGARAPERPHLGWANVAGIGGWIQCGGRFAQKAHSRAQYR